MTREKKAYLELYAILDRIGVVEVLKRLGGDGSESRALPTTPLRVSANKATTTHESEAALTGQGYPIAEEEDDTWEGQETRALTLLRNYGLEGVADKLIDGCSGVSELAEVMAVIERSLGWTKSGEENGAPIVPRSPDGPIEAETSIRFVQRHRSPTMVTHRVSTNKDMNRPKTDNGALLSPPTGSAAPDSYRRHDFYDTKRGVPVYGVDARVRPGKWMHLAEDGKPVLFDAPEDRDAKLKELRKSLRQNA